MSISPVQTYSNLNLRVDHYFLDFRMFHHRCGVCKYYCKYLTHLLLPHLVLPQDIFKIL